MSEILALCQGRNFDVRDFCVSRRKWLMCGWPNLTRLFVLSNTSGGSKTGDDLFFGEHFHFG